MFNIKKHDDTIEGLTPQQLKERKESDKEANFIHKEIIYIIKSMFLVSMFILIGILLAKVF